MKYTESKLEQSFIELLQTEGYIHLFGKDIERKNNQEVLIRQDLADFLLQQHPDLEVNEIEALTNELAFQSASNLYDSNKYICKLVADGLIFKRHNPLKKDIHVRYVDVNPETCKKNNTYKVVSQFEIQGNHLRIPDLILYINGIPLVVFELKTVIEEEIKIKAAFDQLTIRYQRDIPELLKYKDRCKELDIFEIFRIFFSWN